MLKIIIIFVLLILAAWFIKDVVLVNRSVADRSTNELSTLASCKTIYAAADTYRQVNGEYPDSLRTLGSEKPPYISNDLAKGRGRGYSYSYEKTKEGFFVTASPVTDKTGRFEFSIDESKRVLVCDKDRHCMTENEYFESRNQINYNDLSHR